MKRGVLWNLIGRRGRQNRLLKVLSVLAVISLVCLAGNIFVWRQVPRKVSNNLNKKHVSTPRSVSAEKRQVKSSEDILMLGSQRQSKVFLTIGIPTVCRINGYNYLNTTLESIMNSTAPDELSRIQVVVAVSYLNKTCAKQVKSIIQTSFAVYVETGVIQLIGIPVKTYPPLHNLRRTFGDKEYRVHWRSKQNIDYAFLMTYCQNKSDYYIQLEDDVSTVPGYFKVITSYMEEVKDYWAILEFSSLGFIGKLFRSEDLHKMSSLLREFYAEQPCDYHLIHFIKLMVQQNRFLKIPTLFQHHGIHSSLPNLLRNTSDKFYQFGVKTLKGDNPEAEIFTSLKTFQNNFPDNAYRLDVTGVFWSLSPKIGESLILVFKQPQCLKRIAILSGFPGRKSDRIVGGILEAGNKVLHLPENNIVCTGLKYLGEITKGSIDKDKISSKCDLLENRTKCVKLTFTQVHKDWMLIREIAVFTQ